MLARLRNPGGLGLVRSGGLVFAINIAGLGMAAIAQLLLARTLGAVEFGFYAYAFAWLSLSSLIATGGFQPSVLRFGTIYVSQDQHELMRRLSNLALLVSASIGCLLLALGTALIIGFGDRLQDGLGRHQ